MSTLHIYTDGSCSPNPGPGGWAFVILDHIPRVGTVRSGRNEKISNNRMEITAVIEALKHLPGNPVVIHIHTDSQYVIKCATRQWKRKKNRNLWEEFESVCPQCEIRWHWVKAHNGDEYNEKVDRLANEAREK